MTETSSRSRAPAWPLALFPALKLALHVATLRGYGIFRDELYYVVCSERLAFGYVDHPPLSLLLLRVWRELFGESLATMRVLSALLGAATVFLVGWIARRLGGGAFAQTLAMASALGAPTYLAVHHIYSMNAISGLVWAGAGLLLVEICRGGRPSLWLGLGVVLGLGLQNKISVLWLGFGLLVGLLATSQRRWLATPWPWAGGGIAFLLFLPHVAWQIVHDWPTREFIRNATGRKMAEIGPFDFLLGQVEGMGPGTAPIWIAGLVWLFASEAGRRFRVLGWIWVSVLLLLVLMGSSRTSYLAPSYTFLFAAGGLAWEGLFDRLAWPRLRWALPAFVFALGAVFAPFGLPVLPVDDYVGYAEALGVAPSTEERKELGRLPQFYADMHGWESIAGTVAEVVDGLPPEDRERAVVFGENYGVASAVEVLGRRFELPPAVSGHNNYWLWGPRGSEGEVVVVVGGDREDLEELFASVERRATTDCGECMPYEDGRPVWVARGLRVPMEELWPRLKHYD